MKVFTIDGRAFKASREGLTPEKNCRNGWYLAYKTGASGTPVFR